MTKPDWGRLTPTTYVKVWEACVLSVGLEPSSMEFEDNRWGKHKEETRPYITSKSFPTPEVEKNYKALFRDLVANLFVGNHFHVKNINYLQGKGYCGIRLDEFVRWATLNVEWLDFPPELAALVIDKSNSNSTPTEFKVKPVSVVVIAQSCIDEDAVDNLLANLSEVNPSSASGAGQAGDVKSSALEGKVGDEDKKSHQQTSSDRGKDGANIRTIKRLNDINKNNKHKKNFNSLLEVYEFFLKEYESKSEENPTLKEPHIYDEIAREFGAGGNGNLLFQGSSIKTQVSKIRPKK